MNFPVKLSFSRDYDFYLLNIGQFFIFLRAKTDKPRPDNTINIKKIITMSQVNKKAENAETVVNAVSKTDEFFNKNKKLLIGLLTAVVVIAAGSYCFYKFYWQAAVEEAKSQVVIAERNFNAENWEVALNGDGDNLGFVQIIDQYGSKGGDAVYYYAGVCELKLKNYEDAIEYLNKYKGGDDFLAPRAIACKGDAYVGLQEYAKALDCFEKAAAKKDNVFAAGYLMKAAAVCEKLGNNEKALALYKKVKDQYPNSIEGREIDKYISRIENK